MFQTVAVSGILYWTCLIRVTNKTVLRREKNGMSCEMTIFHFLQLNLEPSFWLAKLSQFEKGRALCHYVKCLALFKLHT